jgi:hypothetical protein
MRIRFEIIAAFCVLAPQLMPAAPVLSATKPTTVGKYLQAPTVVALSGGPLDREVDMTVTSNDPEKFLLARKSADKGSASIVVTLRPGLARSPQFYVQGLVDSGTATYTASAPGYGTIESTVTFSPSGLVLRGPHGFAPSFQLTSHAAPANITVCSMRLDDSLAPAEAQPVRRSANSSPRSWSSTAAPIAPARNSSR